MNITWNSPVLDPSGYGNCAREYIKALYQFKHNVSVVPEKYFVGNANYYINEDDRNIIHLLTKRINSLKSTHVEHKTPQILTRTRYKQNIAYSVWETDHISPRWSATINSKDQLWTASKFSANAFSVSGVKVPIKIIPHIIDTSKFISDGKQRRTLFILFNGEFTSRKGVDILIRA